ncbi:tetratricopeptide repeat protein [Seongchinamella sediminis]|uniref:Tetratricopeptide repeat protein n=1 Tax=Seongchinamella sediminis TaxID=2283635 RepID=A0A3L7DZR2_9GAMM|nr:tetratricopeptide repeat protein [Seongchinamella sediminis]RLQ22155.1 tetratricopeptide repeat protein [Seongchinamella sediminis]
MRMLKIIPRLAAVTSICTLAACGGSGFIAPDQPPQVYTPTQLLDGSLLAEPMADPQVELLAVNDDMRAFLAEHLPDGGNKKQKVEKILEAILDDGLRLDYNLFYTLTAEEAFYTREGNCMSFTNLFVALAREAGINATFQEVEVPPTWESRNESWLFNKHLNAVVDLPGGSMMVDFALGEFNTDYDRHLLDDEEVLARYHNNMGVHLMMDGELQQAFPHFRKAIELAPDTGYVWTNLGSLYRRLDNEAAAEGAYLEGIAVARDPAAMSNLARLYQARGRTDLAAWYEGKVELFRLNNPYYLHQLAREAFDAGQYELAVSHSRSALRRDGDKHEMHSLLGMSYVKLGDYEAASKAFRSAAARAEDAGQKAGYSKKLEMLAQH